MARLRLVKIVLLFAFGISHLPGFGLHAIIPSVGPDEGRCCSHCVLDFTDNCDSEEPPASGDEDSGYPCLVCRLLAEVFVAECAFENVAVEPHEFESAQVFVSLETGYCHPTPPSRGPPEIA